MKDVVFGLGTKYDDGIQTSVAIDNNGYVVEVHKSQVLQKLWYRTGKANQMHVDWFDSTNYDTGIDPSVAINDVKTVVEVHKSETRQDIYYHVGRLEQPASQKPIVNWGKSQRYDSGVNPDVAVDNSDWCVEVHKSEGADSLWYHVGKINVNNKEISWGNSVQYDYGAIPRIAMNNNNIIVEVHKSQGASFDLWYRVGIIDKNAKRIAWGQSIRYDSGSQPTIAITDDNFVIEIHQGGYGGDLWRRVGTIDVSGKTISWSDASNFDRGQTPSVACAKDGSMAIQTHQSPLETTMFFSTSRILDRMRWMEVMYDSIKSKQLWEITLPASHDAGAYRMSLDRVPSGCRDLKLNDSVKAIADKLSNKLNDKFNWDIDVASIMPDLDKRAGIITRRFSETHNTSIFEQLTAGIRVFDLRAYYDGTDFFAYHDVKGTSFIDMLTDLVNFLRNTSRELVILDISGFACSFNDEIHGKFISLIKSMVGSYLFIDAVNNLLTTTIQDYTGKGSRVMIWYEDEYVCRKNEIGFYHLQALSPKNQDHYCILHFKKDNLYVANEKYGAAMVNGSYANMDVYEDMSNYNLGQLGKYRGDASALYQMSWTLTFQNIETVTKGSTLRYITQTANRFLGQFMSKIGGSHINILYVDFENDARATDCAIEHFSPRFSGAMADPSQEGQIVTGFDRRDIYVIDQGMLRHIPDPTTYKRVFNQVTPLQVDVTQFIEGRPISPASRLISSGGAIYFEDVDASGKPQQRWISCPAALVYTFNPASVQAGDLTNPGGANWLYHELEGLMTAGMTSGTGGIFFHDQGFARLIPDMNVLNRLFRPVGNITTRDNYYCLGRPLSFSSRLITAPGNPVIYFQDEDEEGNPIKRNITSPEAFNYYWFDWGKVQKIDPTELDSMKEGPKITIPQGRFKGVIGSIRLEAKGGYNVHLRFQDITQGGREINSGSSSFPVGEKKTVNPGDFDCKHNDIIQLRMPMVGTKDVITAPELFIYQKNGPNIANYHSLGALGSTAAVQFDGISG